jgi:hypothetical protein
MSSAIPRFWWDSAGPTYCHQVSGLLGYDIPKSQLLYAHTLVPHLHHPVNDYTDVSRLSTIAPAFPQPGSLDAILVSSLLTDTDRTTLFSTNARNAFADKVIFRPRSNIWGRLDHFICNLGLVRVNCWMDL